MDKIFIGISILLPLISSATYFRAILLGLAKPHRTTRLVILVITLLSTSSLLASHNQVAVWLAGVSAFQGLIFFLLSLKYGMGGWAKTDIFCLTIALVGIVFWKSTANPIFGLYASILADLAGMVPTLLKAYRLPQTEVWYFFGLDALAGVFNFLALTSFTIPNLSYPLYILLVNGVMTTVLLKHQIKV